MARTISLTKARDNFSALVRRASTSEEAVIVASRNQPKVVIVDQVEAKNSRKYN